MESHQLDSHLGCFELKVLHYHPKSPERAWNAADELLLKQLEDYSWTEDKRVLVVNDSSGALAVSLHQQLPESWGDHHTQYLALKKNLTRNQIGADDVHFIPSVESLSGVYDVVLIQIPKNLSLLQYQLLKLRDHLSKHSLVIGGGMVKHLSKTMIDMFSNMLGPSHTSLAEKKARLVFSTFDPELEPAPLKLKPYGVPNSPIMLSNQANVFSRQKLDVGTRFLLENFPDIKPGSGLLDLGCGNGALGIYAGWKEPRCQLVFVDESYMAVSSAQDNFEQNGLSNDAKFVVNDALEDLDIGIGETDMVLCNPPFHEGNKVHIEIAKRMFRGAAKLLARDGQLIIVANRHLKYHSLLKRNFRSVSLLASNNKFVIISAIK